MPEPVPTTDKPGKKLSKTTLILIGGGGIVLFLIYRAKKKKEEEEKPTGGAYTAQSFIPVTGENVAGAGAVGASPTVLNPEINNKLLESQLKNTEVLTSYLIEAGRTKNEQPQVAPITGGGAPYSPPPVSAAPPPYVPPAPVPAPPPARPPSPSCPSGWKYNPANGAPGPHSCYHISRETCKNGKCNIHGYQDGHEVCPC